MITNDHMSLKRIAIKCFKLEKKQRDHIIHYIINCNDNGNLSFYYIIYTFFCVLDVIYPWFYNAIYIPYIIYHDIYSNITPFYTLF